MMLSKFMHLAIASGLMSIAAPAANATGSADAALLKLVNNTSVTIRFYIDGRTSCAASPGSYCNDSTSVGTHTFYSRFEDPNYLPQTACEATDYYVPAEGFTWTCG